MVPVVSQIYIDMAHRCVRETLNLVRQGRTDEALEVAEWAAGRGFLSIGGQDQ